MLPLFFNYKRLMSVRFKLCSLIKSNDWNLTSTIPQFLFKSILCLSNASNLEVPSSLLVSIWATYLQISRHVFLQCVRPIVILKWYSFYGVPHFIYYCTYKVIGPHTVSSCLSKNCPLQFSLGSSNFTFCFIIPYCLVFS